MDKWKYIVFIGKWLILAPLIFSMYTAANDHQWDKAAFCTILLLGIDQFYLKDKK
jgi:hypothetical protein